MPNQQIFPQSTYPITGDVQSTPGSPFVRVVGFQGTAVSSGTPTDGQVFVFNSATNSFVLSSTTSTQANKSIQVNGVVMSDDYSVSVDAVLGISNSPMFVNGA